MKNYAKKIVLSVITSLLLSAGFAQAAQVIQGGAMDSPTEIVDLQAGTQGIPTLCEGTGNR